MKHWFVILSIIISIICIVIGYAFYEYFTPPTEREPYKIAHHHDDTLRIAYIGDSWAAMHKEHKCIIAKMIEDSIHRPVKVSSFGIHGKTSKEIYEYLFNNHDMRHFMMQGYDFCFISAGINDTYKKMSTSYYRISMDNIIHFMLINNIHPIILDIPNYDIVRTYNRQLYARKLVRRASMTITGTQMDCKTEYRATLNKLINEKHYLNRLSVIKHIEWNNDYKHDLQLLYKKDGMHLNSTGYERLDSCIAIKIIKIIKD